jgi:glycine cleavage system H lipoate-binding protein
MSDEMLWTRAHGRRTKIGFTKSFLASHRVSFVELVEVGQPIEEHAPFGLAQFHAGREAELESPVAGTVVAVNDAVNVTEDPAALADDPEGEGWLVVVET